MIGIIVAGIFAGVYLSQYQKMYSEKNNKKYDDFLCFMCMSFIMLSVAIKFFRPLSKMELGLRKLSRSIGR